MASSAKLGSVTPAGVPEAEDGDATRGVDGVEEHVAGAEECQTAEGGLSVVRDGDTGEWVRGEFDEGALELEPKKGWCALTVALPPLGGHADVGGGQLRQLDAHYQST